MTTPTPTSSPAQGAARAEADQRATVRDPLIPIASDARKGKPPCGECHIRPGETCDICGAKAEAEPRPFSNALPVRAAPPTTSQSRPEATASTSTAAGTAGMRTGSDTPTARAEAPAGERIAPTFTASPSDPPAVRVTAADYNGHSWDGSPFSAWAEWLGQAITAEAIRAVTPGSTDYAEFEVDTRHGCILASPGDWIALGYGGRLLVLRDVTAPIHTPRKPMEAN